MSIAEFAAQMAGVPQATIDEVEKAAPATAALLKLFKDNQPLIAKIEAVAAEAAPLVTQALPLIKQAQAELMIVMPAAMDIVAFVQKQAAKPSYQPDSQT